MPFDSNIVQERAIFQESTKFSERAKQDESTTNLVRAIRLESTTTDERPASFQHG